MEKAFKKGEVVWAKVRGYSWWPGIIKKISLKFSKAENRKNMGNSKEIRILVKFIGDNSHSVLPLDKIEKFEKNFSHFSKTKKKPLLNSIKLAKKYLNGELSLIELKRNSKLSADEASSNQDISSKSDISANEDESVKKENDNDDSSDFMMEENNDESSKEKKRESSIKKITGRKKQLIKSIENFQSETSPMKNILKKIKLNKTRNQTQNLKGIENTSLSNNSNSINNSNFSKAALNLTSSSHQRIIPNINLFPKNYPEEFIFNQNMQSYPVMNHSYSFESYNNNNEDNANKNQNQQQNKFFQIPDSNAKYILNTNLNMQKIMNYNINNINNINTDIPGSKGIKKLLLEKRKMKISKIESSSNFSSLDNTENNNTDHFECDYGYNVNFNKFTTSTKKEIKQIIKEKTFKNLKKETKKNLIIFNSNQKNYFGDKNKNYSNSNNYNLNSDLSLEEDVSNQEPKLSDKLASFESNKILEELKNEEENNRVLLLRKACDGLLFYKINLSGASNAKNLLSNINQIHKVLEEIKNQNTFELICDVLPILKILLNSKDVSVFLASTELCQKIKEKVLVELFECEALINNSNTNNIDKENSNNKPFPDCLASKAQQDFGEIKRLELINCIISEKLKELKKKEEAIKLKEHKKLKEFERNKQIKLKKSKAELTRNIKPVNISNSKEYLGIRKGSLTLFDEKENLETKKNSESKSELENSIKNETTNFLSKSKFRNSFMIRDNNDLVDKKFKKNNASLLNEIGNSNNNNNKKNLNLTINVNNINTSESNSNDSLIIQTNNVNTKRPFDNKTNDNITNYNNQTENEYNKKDINNNNIIKNNMSDNNTSNKNISNGNLINKNVHDEKEIKNFIDKENSSISKILNTIENSNNNYFNTNSNNSNSNSHFNNQSIEIIKFLFEDYLDFKELINVLKSNCNSDSNNKLFEESQDCLTLNNQLSTNISEKSINNNNDCNNNNNSYLIDNSPNDNNSGNFFEDVYSKFNNLSKKLASKRKSLPEIDSMILKKTVIYFDYSLRLKDPDLGNLYNDKIISLYGKIKEVITNSDQCKAKLMIK